MTPAGRRFFRQLATVTRLGKENRGLQSGLILAAIRELRYSSLWRRWTAITSAPVRENALGRLPG